MTSPTPILWGNTMPTIKIAEPKPVCLSPEHNPPTHMVFEPGIYRHICPNCGESQEFTVPQITC